MQVVFWGDGVCSSAQSLVTWKVMYSYYYFWPLAGINKFLSPLVPPGCRSSSSARWLWSYLLFWCLFKDNFAVLKRESVGLCWLGMLLHELFHLKFEHLLTCDSWQMVCPQQFLATSWVKCDVLFPWGIWCRHVLFKHLLLGIKLFDILLTRMLLLL